MAVEINNSNKFQYFTSQGFDASVNETYILTENIYLSSNVHMKLGAGTVFDGQGNTIDMSGVDFDGLFTTGGSSLNTGSVIKNVGVLGGTIIQEGGALVKKLQKFFKVENCYSTGTISNSAGGIAGYYAGSFGSCTITSCYSTGTIGDNAGGIVGIIAGGNNGDCTITSCYSTGTIGQQAGGIAGANAGSYDGDCTITSCYSTGTIGQQAGGITGHQAGGFQGSCTIMSCYSTGTIGQQAGGIAGDYAGGIVNDNDGVHDGDCTITLCYSNYKGNNITNGTSNGSSAMDGNYELPNETEIKIEQNADTMVSNMNGSNYYYVVDTVEPKLYPLLRVFADQVQSPYGVQQNYNMEIEDISGCTDPLYDEYNPQANVDDGSCEFILGCTDLRAINYVEEASKDDGSCTFVNEAGDAPNFTGYDPLTGTLSLVNLRD